MKYVFGFDQALLIKSDLTLEQALLLKYLQLTGGGETTYRQILSDLPILHIREKQLSRLLEGLISKGFVSKIKTKYGFILETSQKCLVLNSRVDKKVQSAPVETGQKCPLPNYIYNNKINRELYIKYIECCNSGTSNVIDLVNKWHDTTQKEIFILPDSNYDAIFDIDSLLQKLVQSKIAINFSFKSVLKNYSLIMEDSFKDFKQTPILLTSTKIANGNKYIR